MVNYSYKARVLATVDSCYNSHRAKPIGLLSIDAKFKSESEANNIHVPSTYKKRVRLTLGKLVSEGWLIDKGNNSYLPSPRLRKIIAQEKSRLKVAQNNSDLKTFGAIARKLSSVPPAASPTPSPARQSNRTSLPEPVEEEEEEQEANNATEEEDAITVRNVTTIRRNRPRYSDPGPHLLNTAGSSTINSRKRNSLDAPNSAATGSTPIAGRRRRSTAASRARRRHTLAAVPFQLSEYSFPPPVSKEMQFIPLRQALTARTRRALRRSGLSEEMNNIEAERRLGQKKNREELARLRAELAENTKRLSDLQQQLAAARTAPSEPATPLPPVREEDEDMNMDMDMDVDMGFVRRDSSPDHAPMKSYSPHAAVSETGSESARSTNTGENTVSKRDKTVLDLEAQIEALKEDIQRRVDEEQSRVQEDEAFHEAEEQIMRDEIGYLKQRMEEVGTPRTRQVTFEKVTEEVFEDDSYMGPTADDFDDNYSDSEHDGNLTLTSSRIDNEIAACSQPQPEATIDDERHRRLEELEKEKEEYRRTIESLSEKVKELEDEAEESHIGMEETRRKAEELRAENEGLKVTGEKLYGRLMELEEMEGERFENMVDESVQVTDREKVKMGEKIEEMKEKMDDLQEDLYDSNRQLEDMEEKVEGLTEQVDELEEMVAAVKEEKMALESQIAVLNAQISASENAAEAGQRDKKEVDEEVKELREKVQSLEESLKILAEEKEEMTSEKDGYLVQIEELNEVITNLTTANEALELQINELKGEIGGLRTEVRELNDEVDGLSSRVKELEMTVELSEADKAALLITVGELEKRIEELENNVVFSNEEKTELESNIFDLNTQLDSLREAAEIADKTKTGFERDIAELRAQADAFEKAAHASRDEKESFERDIDILQNKVLTLESALALAEEGKEGLERDIAQINAQIESFKQALDAAAQEKEKTDEIIASLSAEVEVLKRAAKASNQDKKELEDDIAKLSARIASLVEESDAVKAENELLKQELSRHESEIERLTKLLEECNEEKETMAQEIVSLEAKVSSLEDGIETAKEEKKDFKEEIEKLNYRVRDLEQAAEVAKEEKSIIQQKIRPYIQGEQSIDMAVDEVLTELVMAKNRADENERIRVELIKKIKILAQEDADGDSEMTSPEDVVDKLTDRFKEVRDRIEELFAHSKQQDSALQLGNFTWECSNENALDMLGALAEDLYEKFVETQKVAMEQKQGREEEKILRSQYAGYIDNVAMTVRPGLVLSDKSHIYDVVRERLETFKKQLEEAEDAAEKLEGAMERKDKTIKNLEMDIDQGKQRETGLNEKLNDVNFAKDILTAKLEKSLAGIEKLNETVADKDAEIGVLETELFERKAAERELLERIEQQTMQHNAEISGLQEKRDEAIARVEEILAIAVQGRAGVEAQFAKAIEENGIVIKGLEERITLLNGEVKSANERLVEMKKIHHEAVEQLEIRISEGQKLTDDIYKQLQETVHKSKTDKIALESQLFAEKQETARQTEALKQAILYREKVARQFNAEIESNEAAAATLEKEIQTLKNNAQMEKAAARLHIASIQTDFENFKEEARREKEGLESSIDIHKETIDDLNERIGELEDALEEAENSEAALEEELKATESQAQLLDEQAHIAKQALENEKRQLQQELDELRAHLEVVRTDMKTDMEALQKLVGEKSKRIAELETSAFGLKGEKVRLEKNVLDLESDVQRLEKLFDAEQQKGIEIVTNLQQEVAKFAGRFGDAKNQFVKESVKRSAEAKRKRDEDAEAEGAMESPPTPTSTAQTEGGKLRGKRRKYDSAIGFEDEFEGASQLGV
ncbi:Vesicle-mediated ER to Golgi transport protein [Rhizina undulata]